MEQLKFEPKMLANNLNMDADNINFYDKIRTLEKHVLSIYNYKLEQLIKDVLKQVLKREITNEDAKDLVFHYYSNGEQKIYYKGVELGTVNFRKQESDFQKSSNTLRVITSIVFTPSINLKHLKI